MNGPSPRALATRWIGALFGPLALLGLLLGFAAGFFKLGHPNVFLTNSGSDPTALRFGLMTFLREVLPLYEGVGFLLFVLAILPARFGWLGKGGWEAWSGRHAFWGTFGLLALVHGILWWRVPMTLGVLPGLFNLPLGLALALVLGLPFLAFSAALRWSKAGWTRKAPIMGYWALLAWASLLPPTLLARQGLDHPPEASGHPAKILMISLDGLRQDVALSQGFRDLRGYRFENAYAAIPATRLEWSMIWGGDPRHYSLGNVMPSLSELEGHNPYEILEAGKAKGLKARFYIDDGGTIGLTDKEAAFDQVGMPARGWENFVNSSLSVHVPLYAFWLDALRIFPSTTPWTPLDLGLRRALDEGRGADWVMFHSCLAHQPIYLDRNELALIPGWWRIPADKLMPFWQTPSDKDIAAWKPAYDPFLGYQIRIRSILASWKTIWSQLPTDPDYGPATRFLMTDHGERFYHVTDNIQIAGVHGFCLDPWELRIPLVMDGPGIQPGVDTDHAVSLLTLRNLVAKDYLDGTPVRPADMTAPDDAFMRMNTIQLFVHNGEPRDYRQIKMEDIIQGGKLLPDGLWVMAYKKPEAEREKDLSVGEAHGRTLTIWRPLIQGGARRFTYDGYDLTDMKDVSEADFQKARTRIFTSFLTHWDGKPGWDPAKETH